MTNPSQISNLTAEQAWKLIDKVLLGVKTSEIAEEMHKKIAQAKAVAHAEGVRKRNGAYYPFARIRLEEEAAEEWANKLYDAALSVWQIQGYKPCLPFFRAMYGHLLAPLLAARRGAVTSDMRLTEIRTGTTGSTQAHQGAFARAIGRLQSRWSRRAEAAGREFEYVNEREDRLKTELRAEQTKASAKRARAARVLPKAQARRRQVILGVLELNLKGLNYCRALDRQRLPIPETWREAGCPGTYQAAYCNEKWALKIQHEKSNFERRRKELGAAQVAKILSGPTRSTR